MKFLINKWRQRILKTGKKLNNSYQLKVINNPKSPEMWFNYFRLLLNTDVIVDPVYNNDVQIFMENHDLY